MQWIDLQREFRTRASGLVGAILVLSACLWPTIGSAQENIGLSVIPGAGGIVRTGAAMPVVVVATNSGPTVDAVVAVRWISDAGRPGETTTFRRLNLPSDSSKRFMLYVQPGSWADAIDVSLREGSDANAAQRGRVLARFTEKLTTLGTEETTLGVIGPPMAGLPNPLDKEGEPTLHRLYFAEDFMPDDALGWEMCDAVVYAPTPDSRPSRRQLEGLVEWAALGGDLIMIAAELSPVYGSSEFEDALPFVPVGQQQQWIEALEREALVAIGRIAGGDVLLHSEGVPLVVQRRFGLGTVTVFAFDAGQSRFGESLIGKTVWRRATPNLFVSRSEDFMAFDTQRYDAFTQQLVQGVTRTPDVRVQLFVVVVLIGLYAAAAGPGDYWLARRLKRPMLTWITFPAMVLVFTSIAFLGARVWVGGEQELHAHRLQTYFPDEGVAVFNEAAGLFAAGTRYYALRSESGAPLRPLEGYLDVPDRTTIDQDEDLRVQRIPTWTARAYTATRVERRRSPVTFEIDRSQPPVLTVRNESEQSIQPRYVATRGTYWRLPRNVFTVLQPGEEVRGELQEIKQDAQIALGRNPSLEGSWGGETAAPRFRSWDHAALIRGRDDVFSYSVVNPEDAVLEIDGAPVRADSSATMVHLVRRNRSQPLNPMPTEEPSF